MLFGPAESRLLSVKVTPTVPSAPVTSVSAWRTEVPICTGKRLPSRSRCTAPVMFLIWPMSCADAATAKAARHTAMVQRIAPPGSMVFPCSDSIMPPIGEPPHDKFPLDDVSLQALGIARNKHVSGGLLQRHRGRARALPAPEPRPGGIVHQHRASRPRRRQRRAGVDDALLGRRGCSCDLRGHGAALQSLRAAARTAAGYHAGNAQDRRARRTAHEGACSDPRLRLPLWTQPHPSGYEAVGRPGWMAPQPHVRRSTLP